MARTDSVVGGSTDPRGDLRVRNTDILIVDGTVEKLPTSTYCRDQCSVAASVQQHI